MDLSRTDVDAVKGFLILSVVLGHSPILDGVPGYRNLLYSFHVHGFLLMLFVFKAHQLSAKYTLDRMARYLIPYTAWVLLCGVLWGVVCRFESGLCAWSISLIRGWFFGSATMLKTSVGLQLYWFLPVLFCLNVVRSIYANWTAQKQFVVLLILLLAHPFFSPHRALLRCIPLQLPVALFIFPLGLLTEVCWSSVRRDGAALARVLTVALGVSLLVAVDSIGSTVRLGLLYVHGWGDIHLLVLHDLVAVCAFLSILIVAPVLRQVPFLAWIGQRSLTVYVSHQVFIVLLAQCFSVAVHKPSHLAFQFAWGFLITTLSVALALVLHETIWRFHRLRALLFPRSFAEFWLAAKCSVRPAQHTYRQ